MRDPKKIKIGLHSYFFGSCGLVGFVKSLFANSIIPFHSIAVVVWMDLCNIFANLISFHSL